jgi:hypothetical protein
MALDFLIIQAMLTEYERFFSAAGKMMVPERNKLKIEIFAICQVLRLWFAANVIKNSNVDLEPLQFNEDNENNENSDDEMKVGGGAKQQDNNAGGITSEDAE